MKRFLKSFILTIFTLGLLGLGGLYLFTNLFSSPDYESNKQVKVFLEQEEIVEFNEPKIISDEMYVSANFAKDILKADVLWDLKDSIISIYDGENIQRIYLNKEQIKINDGELKNSNITRMIEQEAYIKMSYIEDIAKRSMDYYNKSNRYILRDKKRPYVQYKADRTVRIRKDKDIWSEVVDKTQKGDILTLISEDDEWIKVISHNGYFGYVQKKNVSLYKEVIKVEELKLSEAKSFKRNINMVWEYAKKNKFDLNIIKDVDNLDVMSPTWFEFKDGRGNLKVENAADTEYVKWAHKKGYEVWGLFSNSYNPKMTSEIINSAKNREHAINQIIKLCNDYNLNGINIDFENVYYEDKEKLTQFIKELYPIAKKNNLVVSMDITTTVGGSDDWSKVYDRKELHKYLDYLILMAYDEYWATSPKSGPVASYPWVERSLKELTELVPKNKIILGVPFYTRSWKETKNSSGKTKVTSSTLSMRYTDSYLEKNNAKKTWNEELKAYYTEFKSGNAVYKIWLEEEKSIVEKLNLVEKYGIQGAAFWRRGFEDREIWGTVHEVLHN